MEPCKRSVYDVLQHNLKLCGRKMYIHRFIYGGEHKGEKETEEAFRKIVKITNDSYCEEKLTGVLILYPNYFIHLFDGDEITFGGHLKRLFLAYDDLLENVKLFAIYHHVNQRFFDEWVVRKAKPPILLEKIDPGCDFEELQRYLGICITKIYNLAIELREVDPETDGPITVGEILPYMNQFLPEYVLLNFLVKHKQLLEVRNVLHFESLLLDTTYMMQGVWPVRSDYIPMNVFEMEKNIIPYLNVKEK